MAFTNAVKEAAVANVVSTATHISLHTGDPGTTGTAEATGGSYVRKAISFTAGASDGNTVGGSVTFDANAATYTHVGLWTASTSGTFVGGFALSSSAVLASAGQVVVSTTTVTVA